MNEGKPQIIKDLQLSIKSLINSINMRADYEDLSREAIELLSLSIQAEVALNNPGSSVRVKNVADVNSIKKIQRLTKANQTEVLSDVIISETDEVNRSYKELRLWAQRPRDAHYKILVIFLEIEAKNPDVDMGVLRTDLLTQCNRKYNMDSSTFNANLVQMSVAGQKNSVKIFEITHGIVRVWHPIKFGVVEFSNLSRGNIHRG